MVRAASLAHTLACLWLTVLLLVGGPLLNRAWAKGGHGTPEHWAYHLLMMSLGAVNHHASHGSDESSPTGSEAGGIAFAVPGPSAVTSVYGVALLAIVVAAIGVATLRPQRLLVFEVAVPFGQPSRPIDRPPRER